jgi:sporulation protein YlmC with PRC-barrel domain
MRVSELLDDRVYAADGTEIGKVHDVRLVRDAPSAEGDDAAFRVDALLVGRVGLATRLGFVRNGVQGPWLLRTLATRREQRAEEIPWSEVEQVDGRLVRRSPG